MFEAIFYESPVYKYTDDFGYSIGNDGLTGTIMFDRDMVKDRRQIENEEGDKL
jgi:hypothetical protein